MIFFLLKLLNTLVGNDQFLEFLIAWCVPDAFVSLEKVFAHTYVYKVFYLLQ